MTGNDETYDTLPNEDPKMPNEDTVPNEDPQMLNLNEDPKVAFRASTMSKASTKFDIGNKGYLTEAERMARNFDQSNRGLLTNEKVVMIVEETMKLKEAHSSLLESVGAMKKIMFMLMFLIVVLSLCNLGTSFVAVRLAKEISIGEDGHLRSTKDGTAIHTVGNGQIFNMKLEEDLNPYTGLPYGCMPIEEVSKIYKSSRDGVTTSLVVQENSTDSASHEMGLSLTFAGSVMNDTHMCLPSLDGKTFCADFESHACVSDRRNLKEKDPAQTAIRRNIFQMHVEGAPLEKIEERRLCVRCPIYGNRRSLGPGDYSNLLNCCGGSVLCGTY